MMTVVMMRCKTHMMKMEVTMSEAVKKPLWQSAFFLCLWCISPPQLSQQRHTQKQVPTMGTSTRNSRPREPHTRKPAS